MRMMRCSWWAGSEGAEETSGNLIPHAEASGGDLQLAQNVSVKEITCSKNTDTDKHNG